MLFLLDLDLVHMQHFTEFLNWGMQFFGDLILYILLSFFLVPVISLLKCLCYLFIIL
jgi:hypothetical protein